MTHANLVHSTQAGLNFRHIGPFSGLLLCYHVEISETMIVDEQIPPKPKKPYILVHFTSMEQMDTFIQGDQWHGLNFRHIGPFSGLLLCYHVEISETMIVDEQIPPKPKKPYILVHFTSIEQMDTFIQGDQWHGLNFRHIGPFSGLLLCYHVEISETMIVDEQIPPKPKKPYILVHFTSMEQMDTFIQGDQWHGLNFRHIGPFSGLLLCYHVEISETMIVVDKQYLPTKVPTKISMRFSIERTSWR